MNTLYLDAQSHGDLRRAAELIRAGELVAFPTETVYGLGADATNAAAVDRIYQAKGRETDNPLIVHVADPEEIERYAVVRDRALFLRLANAFMPGPLTVIFERGERICPRVSAGLPTVAIRCPAHPAARELIRLSGVPIAAPSANRSHRPSPTAARHVKEDLDGIIAAILDGGNCDRGVESTVISVTGDMIRVLRPGVVTPEDLGAATGKRVELDPGVVAPVEDHSRVASPGMKYRHYAPKAPMCALCGEESRILSFFSEALDRFCGVLCYREDLEVLGERENAIALGSRTDPEELARNLFDCLRAFDQKPFLRQIYTRLPENVGVNIAVRNRLLRACEFCVKKV